MKLLLPIILIALTGCAKEVRRVFDMAPTNLIPLLALEFFAGIRPETAEQID